MKSLEKILNLVVGVRNGILGFAGREIYFDDAPKERQGLFLVSFGLKPVNCAIDFSNYLRFFLLLI